MKKRNCFVSNSSSSSFIVCNDKEKEQFNSFKHYNIQFFKIKELLKDSKELYNNIKSFHDKYVVKHTAYTYDFLLPYSMYDMNETLDIMKCNIDRYEQLIKKYGENVSVTSPIDRDEAIEDDIYLPTFETDL